MTTRAPRRCWRSRRRGHRQRRSGRGGSIVVTTARGQRSEGERREWRRAAHASPAGSPHRAQTPSLLLARQSALAAAKVTRRDDDRRVNSGQVVLYRREGRDTDVTRHRDGGAGAGARGRPQPGDRPDDPAPHARSRPGAAGHRRRRHARRQGGQRVSRRPDPRRIGAPRGAVPRSARTCCGRVARGRRAARHGRGRRRRAARHDRGHRSRRSNHPDQRARPSAHRSCVARRRRHGLRRHHRRSLRRDQR